MSADVCSICPRARSDVTSKVFSATPTAQEIPFLSRRCFCCLTGYRPYKVSASYITSCTGILMK